MITFGDLLKTVTIWDEIQTSIRVQTKDKKTLYDSYYVTCRFCDCWELKLENANVISLNYDTAHVDTWNAFEVTLDIDSHSLFLDTENDCYISIDDLRAEYHRNAPEIRESIGVVTFDEYVQNCTSIHGTLCRVCDIDDSYIFGDY